MSDNGNSHNINNDDIANYETVANNKNYDENIELLDKDLSSVKPVYILEKEIFGNIKPKPAEYVTHTRTFMGSLTKLSGEAI